VWYAQRTADASITVVVCIL
jgi:hypothetical protein